jgi:hypothetical protein
MMVGIVIVGIGIGGMLEVINISLCIQIFIYIYIGNLFVCIYMSLCKYI